KGYFLPPENWRYGADSGWREPTVFVPIFVRNKAHALPYFLNCLSNLDYPKSRMSLWIVTDHNSDNSTEILEKWVESVKGEYHELVLEKPETEWFYENQTSNLDWPKERHIHMLQLRQAGLVKAREKWSDYVLYIDADNMLVNPYTLQQLISKDVAIVAPMLTTIASYSNFWAAQDENGYYERADNYFTIRNRVEQGLFEVPMVHSTFLVNLVNRKSRKIQFWPLHEDYHLDLDDIIVFSIHAKLAGMTFLKIIINSHFLCLYVDNTYIYGCMPIPLPHHKTLIEEVEVFTHFLMEIMSKLSAVIQPIETLKIHVPATNLGFDKIFMINLERREDRYYRMATALQLQGISFSHFKAIDSKSLNSTYLKGMGIDMLPGYVDPYRERTLTRGEIGCFLSHYFIWQEVVEKRMEKVIVFEDDLRFEVSFNRRLENVMREIEDADLEWDLIYLGRKRMQVKVPEKRVDGCPSLVEADYSYWTLAYALSLSGAQKLLDGKPLHRMVPVDEYLPIMFNKHPIAKYMEPFETRDLKAFSVEPLYVYPTHYTGQINYFSDTETSSIWDD
uniref:Glycosyl transferase family 25 domain-containing protein n=1 Tax=Ciona savignyi TaxID=51511 RepID=H2YSF8_CIOSA